MSTKPPADPAVTEPAERIAQLEAENRLLRAQLDDAGRSPRRGAGTPEHTFVLSEGSRAELAMTGLTTAPGGRALDVEAARKLTKTNPDQQRVEVTGPDDSKLPARPDRGAPIYGVDYVYPSVSPGVLHPDAAGQPGVSGSSER